MRTTNHCTVLVQYNTIQYNTIQYNTIQYNTITFNNQFSPWMEHPHLYGSVTLNCHIHLSFVHSETRPTVSSNDVVSIHDEMYQYRHLTPRSTWTVSVGDGSGLYPSCCVELYFNLFSGVHGSSWHGTQDKHTSTHIHVFVQVYHDVMQLKVSCACLTLYSLIPVWWSRCSIAMPLNS